VFFSHTGDLGVPERGDSFESLGASAEGQAYLAAVAAAANFASGSRQVMRHRARGSLASVLGTSVARLKLMGVIKG
jgi:RNA-splicing ligase RtcB